jgi:hypothetical protein
MAFQVADRVKETTTTTGTGNIALLGASASFRPFSAVCANNDTVNYCIQDVPNNAFETGIGTWLTGNTLVRTTVIASSNSGALVSFAAGTKDVFLMVGQAHLVALTDDFRVDLPVKATEPGAPASNTTSWYAKLHAGRHMPKWKGSNDGMDYIVQPAIFNNNIATYYPTSSTNGGTATLGGVGISWTAGGTVSHPTPATTAPASANQMHRTRYANVVTTANQTLGIISTAAGLPQFWLGNAAGLGGFFFYTRFIVELIPATTVRLFVGLTSLATAMVATDTPAGDYIGLWHDTTDALNAMSLIHMDNTTRVKTAITLTGNLTAGQVFDFWMYAPPNGSSINYRLDDLNAGTTLVDTSISTNIPRNTIFMGPQVTMSNGTANVTVTTVAIGIKSVYVESDR